MPAPQNNTTSAPDEEINVIYTMARNEGEEIQFLMKKFRSRYYIDLRIWFREEGKDELIPTKKGISLSADRIPELQEGLDQLSKAVLKAQELEGAQRPQPRIEKPAPKFPQKPREPQKNWAR